MELTLLAAALTGAASVWATNRILADRIAVERPTDVLIGAAAVGLLVGRLAAMIGAAVNPLTSPGDILIVRGGVSTGFASVGAVAVLAWTHRSTLPGALDQLAPAAIAGLAGWHGGCLWRGACLGTSTELPWAMASAGTSVARHPVELYAAVAFLVAVPVLAALVDRPWLASGVALALAGGVRLATQPLRLSIVGGPVWWYGAAVAVGALVAWFGQSRTRTRPPGPDSIEM